MERYKLQIVNNHGDRYIRCEPAPDGSWVMFKDVAALQARVAELEGVLEGIKEHWNGGDESAIDAAEECRYRAAIALEGKKDE